MKAGIRNEKKKAKLFPLLVNGKFVAEANTERI
jgi:hypothetical protein